MAIKHTAVSYYGMNYEEHARADFREMFAHGCDTVILAITEFDMDFWFPNLNNIIKPPTTLGCGAWQICGASANTSAESRSACFCRTISTTGRYPL